MAGWRAASAFYILENSLSCRRQELLPEQLGLGRRRQSERSVHQLTRIWTHAVNLLLVCFSSDQLRHVPVLRLHAGTAAAEAQRVELLRLLLGKNHLVMQQYLHNQPHRNVQHLRRLWWSSVTLSIRHTLFYLFAKKKRYDGNMFGRRI